ncbi:hypothetical protein ACIBEF_29210 [Micromonospora sp. NPDC050795]|uniref:hypothetical protein n=1 Tax=Micromonospora sp. NPDC050795 TaxID=3364282 RepID=UPI0037B38795
MDIFTINGVEVVDTNTAAAILGLQPRTLIAARSEGRPHAKVIKHGGRVWYDLASVYAAASAA